MSGVDSEKLRQVLGGICQKIGGDWLLAGGSLVQLLFDSNRGTQDIDLVNIRHDHLAETPLQTELFLLAKSLGLTPENLNSAVSFFVRQVPGWQSQIVEIAAGPKGKIYRPTLTLFVYLKLGRASEIDLADIRSAVKVCGRHEFDSELYDSWADVKLREKLVECRSKIGL